MWRPRAATGLALLAAIAFAPLPVWMRGEILGVGWVFTSLLALVIVGLDLFRVGRAALVPPARADTAGEFVGSASTPYRGRLRRALVGAPVPLSGMMFSALVSTCCLAAVLLVPLLIGPATWIAAWVVLLVWWMITFALLSWLLFRGYRFQEDAGRAVLTWTGSSLGTSTPGTSHKARTDWRDLEPPGCIEDAPTVALVAAAFGAARWLSLNGLLPLLFLAAYRLTRSTLARVLDDTHDCQGRLARATSWGGFWSTLYFTPIAVQLWLYRLPLHD